MIPPSLSNEVIISQLPERVRQRRVQYKPKGIEQVLFANLVFPDNDGIFLQPYVEVLEVPKVLDLYVGYSHGDPLVPACGRRFNSYRLLGILHPLLLSMRFLKSAFFQ